MNQNVYRAKIFFCLQSNLRNYGLVPLKYDKPTGTGTFGAQVAYY